MSLSRDCPELRRSRFASRLTKDGETRKLFRSRPVVRRVRLGGRGSLGRESDNASAKADPTRIVRL